MAQGKRSFAAKPVGKTGAGKSALMKRVKNGSMACRLDLAVIDVALAPTKRKKARASTMTSAINRNIEALIIQRASATGSDFNVVKKGAQTVVKARRKDLVKTVANRAVRKASGKYDPELAELKEEIQVIKGEQPNDDDSYDEGDLMRLM